MLLEFTLLFAVFSASSVGVGKLYLHLIKPGELFDFMQNILVEFKHENNFLYKSFGGCELCTRQRFTEVSYILLVAICNPFNGWYNLFHLALFILFGGLSYFLDSLVPRITDQPQIIKSQKLEL
jgi:hypothetical protein